MSTETWHYLENQLDTVTQKSRKRMNSLLTDHHTKINAAAVANAAVFGPMAGHLNTAKTAWTGAYNAWINAKAAYRSASQGMENFLTKLSTRPSPAERSEIGKWESKVSNFWDAGHPRYDFIFPQGREPFTTGGRDAIITEVLNLGTRLVTTAAELTAEANAAPDVGLQDELNAQAAAMSALATQVSAFHTQLTGARTLQQQKEGALDQASSALAPLRETAADAMYKNLGLLMGHFHTKATRQQVADYYDLTLIMTPPADDEDEEPEGGGEGGGGGTPP